MKVVSSIGSLKSDLKTAKLLKGEGRIYVICKTDPRLKS